LVYKTDFVGNVDRQDYYRFDFDKPSGVNITLDGLTEDAEIELAQDLDKNGAIGEKEIIKASEFPTTDAQTINFSSST
jgi:hypothetical protein